MGEFPSVILTFSDSMYVLVRFTSKPAERSRMHASSIASAPNYISESLASRDKSIGASFVVIALTVHELWVPRGAPTQREQSIIFNLLSDSKYT